MEASANVEFDVVLVRPPDYLAEVSFLGIQIVIAEPGPLEDGPIVDCATLKQGGFAVTLLKTPEGIVRIDSLCGMAAYVRMGVGSEASEKCDVSARE